MSKSAGQYLDAAGVQNALNRVLRPLVRLAIKCGVTFPAFVDLLRQLYVNVAEHVWRQGRRLAVLLCGGVMY